MSRFLVTIWLQIVALLLGETVLLMAFSALFDRHKNGPLALAIVCLALMPLAAIVFALTARSAWRRFRLLQEDLNL